jgi:tRNA pseudouridine55 synthase
VAKSFLRPLHGFLLLDKPLGPSSNQALQTVKKTFCAEKAGHTGSLDPLASGMLPICFGAATRYAQYLLNADKTYRAEIRLGQTTTTGDREGKIIEEKPLPLLGEKDIRVILKEFLGKQKQQPPMYSALKYQGKPLYELARRGIEVEREPRDIEIHSISLIDYAVTTITIEVRCSKGTYIRVLAEDIGKRLECGAHLNSLHRLSVEGFSSQQMVSLAHLKNIENDKGLTALQQYILPIDEALKHYPQLNLSQWWLTILRQGKKFVDADLTAGIKRLYDQSGQFKGLVIVDEEHRISVLRLMAY